MKFDKVRGTRSTLRDFDANGLSLALSPLREPSRESFGETFWREAEARLDEARGNGEGIVEFGGVGEVAHAELVQPLQGAKIALTANEDLHFEFLGVHANQG